MAPKPPGGASALPAVTPAARPRANVLGIGISAINLDSALAAIASALAQKARGYVCVTGVHGVMEAQRDAALRGILNRAFLNTPDGMPMVWVGWLEGFRDMDRVYGPDLMFRVCEFTRDKAYTHYLYGGAEGVAPALKQKLESRFPGLKIVGTYTPPFRSLNEREEADLRREISALKPDILWVGLSTPKQEKFMEAYRTKLEVTLMFGVGAAFDFHAGRVRQAPRWMQRSGLEWLFRLGCEPRRLWRRYLKNNPLFALRILGQFTRLKKYGLE
jgi:N-acetylglucosaminyldiphosphoundecaprenol N-acetyl-beta-D-mannosaminyltransferase